MIALLERHVCVVFGRWRRFLYGFQDYCCVNVALQGHAGMICWRIRGTLAADAAQATQGLEVRPFKRAVHDSVHDPVDGVVEEQHQVSSDTDLWTDVFRDVDGIDNAERNESRKHEDKDNE